MTFHPEKCHAKDYRPALQGLRSKRLYDHENDNAYQENHRDLVEYPEKLVAVCAGTRSELFHIAYADMMITDGQYHQCQLGMHPAKA